MPAARPAGHLRSPGHIGDPAYVSCRTLFGADLFTDKEKIRRDELFAHDTQIHLKATWRNYQQMLRASRDTDWTAGTHGPHGPPAMSTLINALSRAVRTELIELVTFGRTPIRRAADLLARLTLPGNSNGLTEAINGRLEHLCEEPVKLLEHQTGISRGCSASGQKTPQPGGAL